jgi:hypothetical protein
MADSSQQPTSSNHTLTPNDISIDAEGRVIVTNPVLASRLKAGPTSRAMRAADNSVAMCGCNVVAGCGGL